MATEQAPPANPAPAGFDMTAFAEAMVKANADAMAAALAPINERLEKLGGGQAPPPAQQAAAAAAAAGAPGLTMKQITDELDRRDQQRRASDQRAAFVAEKLKDLPPAYASQLGGDPAQWAAEEQRIRSTYRDDLKRAGAVVPDVGGPGADAGPAATAVAPGGGIDLSKLSGTQQIELALRTSKPQRGQQPPPAQA